MTEPRGSEAAGGNRDATLAGVTFGFPLGGTGLTCGAYLDFLAVDYVDTYIRAGGAAVRFVVAGSDDVARRWHAGLADLARSEDCLYVALDAAETKMAMIRPDLRGSRPQGRLDGPGGPCASRGLKDVGLPAEDDLSVSAVAARHDGDGRETARSIRRQLEATLLDDTTLAREFRLAVLRLCRAELGTGDVIEVERAAVLAWLRVEPVALRALRRLRSVAGSDATMPDRCCSRWPLGGSATRAPV